MDISAAFMAFFVVISNIVGGHTTDSRQVFVWFSKQGLSLIWSFIWRFPILNYPLFWELQKNFQLTNGKCSEVLEQQKTDVLVLVHQVAIDHIQSKLFEYDVRMYDVV